MWLNEEEMAALTGFVRRSKQRKALQKMGIRFTERARDGFP